MKCTICRKEIVLYPSAKERERNGDKPASYYTSLFREHAECVFKKREAETLLLLRKINAQPSPMLKIRIEK